MTKKQIADEHMSAYNVGRLCMLRQLKAIGGWVPDNAIDGDLDATLIAMASRLKQAAHMQPALEDLLAEVRWEIAASHGAAATDDAMRRLMQLHWSA